MDKQVKVFVKNSILMLTRKILDIVFGFIIMVIIARMLGKEGQGIYTLLTLLPTMIVSFLNFGIAPATVFYTSREERKLKIIFSTNLLIGLFLSSIGIMSGILIIVFFGNKLFNGVPVKLLYLCLIMIPSLMLNSFIIAIFQGLQDFEKYNLIGILQKIFFLIFLVLMFYVDFSIATVLLSFIVTNYLVLVIALILLNKKIRIVCKKEKLKVDFTYIKLLFKYGVKSHISNILAFLNYRIDMMFLASFTNPIAVGIYSIAVSLAERIWLFSQSISSVLLPQVASIKTDKERNKLTNVVSRNVFFISLIISIVIFIFSDVITNILFGNEFITASIAIRVLIPGIVLGSVSRIISNYIAGKGCPEVNMKFAFITVIMNIILNVILIPKYSFLGAAIATTVTYTVNFIFKSIYYKYAAKTFYKDFLIISRLDIIMYIKFLKFIKNKILKIQY